MTNQTDRWLTIREASLELQVSELTVRRRIKDGKLANRLTGGKYLINLALPPPAELDAPAGFPMPLSTQESPRDPQPAAAARQDDGTGDAVIDQRRLNIPSTQSAPVDQAEATGLLMPANFLSEYARFAEQAGRAGVLAERLEEMERRYQSLQEGALALSNRNGWLEGKLEEREEEIKLLADSQHRRSWWQRLFGS